MITDDKNQVGFVIECYDHDALHRVLVVQSNDEPGAKEFQFFYIPKSPQVDFGDTIQMNFAEENFFVSRGNSKLTYRIHPCVFPNTLLLELIAERMNL